MIKKEQEVLQKIIKFYREYKENLENKDYLIIYKKENKLEYLILTFTKENFYHLTGLGRGKSFLTPLKFYKKLESRTLKATEIEIKNFTLKKLSVSNKMIEIFKNKSKIGIYNPNNSYQKKLFIDKGIALSSSESDVVLGMRYTESKKAVPVSLLKQKLENIAYKESITEVLFLFEKNISEEKYNKIIVNAWEIEKLIEENSDLRNFLNIEAVIKRSIK